MLDKDRCTLLKGKGTDPQCISNCAYIYIHTHTHRGDAKETNQNNHKLLKQMVTTTIKPSVFHKDKLAYVINRIGPLAALM